MTTYSFNRDPCPFESFIRFGDIDEPPIDAIDRLVQEEGPNSVRRRLGELSTSEAMQSLTDEGRARWLVLCSITDPNPPAGPEDTHRGISKRIPRAVSREIQINLS